MLLGNMNYKSAMEVELMFNKLVGMHRIDTEIVQYVGRKIFEVESYDLLSTATDRCGQDVSVVFVGKREGLN